MIRILAFALAVLCAVSARAGDAGASGGGFPATGLVLFAGACPSGWTQDDSAQGRYIVGLAASGNAGDTLGSAIATTTTNLTATATSNACATVNFVTTAGATAACSPAFTPTITMGSTADQRSEIAPSVSLRLCKKV